MIPNIKIVLRLSFLYLSKRRSITLCESQRSFCHLNIRNLSKTFLLISFFCTTLNDELAWIYTWTSFRISGIRVWVRRRIPISDVFARTFLIGSLCRISRICRLLVFSSTSTSLYSSRSVSGLKSKRKKRRRLNS